jgi:hypothetical protein
MTHESKGPKAPTLGLLSWTSTFAFNGRLDFQGMRGYRPNQVPTTRRIMRRAVPFGSMSPPDYSSAQLLPSRAGFRFIR